MLDKITVKIKRYPFQTGIIVGVLACLILVGFISLFQDHGQTLSGNSEIIREDYLRMTISEFGANSDSQLAEWRYNHLGSKGSETLKLMGADESVSPRLLADFAKATNHEDVFGSLNSSENGQTAAGTPTNPRKGLSGFGKVLLIILGIGIFTAGGLYLASLIQTKQKQKRRSEASQKFEEDQLNMITPEKIQTSESNEPDTLFDLDSLFPPSDGTQKKEPEEYDSTESLLDQFAEEESGNEESQDENINAIIPEPTETIESDSLAGTESDQEDIEDDSGDISDDDKNDSKHEGKTYYPGLEYESNSLPFDIDEEENDSIKENEIAENAPENAIGSIEEEIIQANLPSLGAEGEEIKAESDVEDDTQPIEDVEIDNIIVEEVSDEDDTEKPLVETDHENEPDGEDELLKMIRAGKSTSDEIIGKNVTAVIDMSEDEENASTEPETVDIQEAVNTSEEELEAEAEAESDAGDDILIHYQSQYRIGNDMYDEVFSIDQGDVFRGECGIGIGETLNNTEPKAVTAFEIWLFDKDDIHTATWYLMSDFALSNDGIRERLEQRGKCDRIRKGDLYTLETETLTVEVKILELEYGNEMDEKNSYFTNVVFDVIAKSK